MYKQASSASSPPPDSEAQDASGTSEQPEEKVVDAEFEEVDKDKK
jgi:molecular chaperone DnaK